ncbi:PIN domain-containing protein [bacterium]|nr:PIN domain-containing protein [bacterium]
MTLPETLRRREGVVIDTNIWIYLLQDHPRFGSTADFIITRAQEGEFTAVITPITVAELLTGPLRDGRMDLADRIRSGLRGLAGVRPVDLPFEAGEVAGALRAKYGLPLPDMMQAAVAMRSARPAIITNDRQLQRVEEVEVFLPEAFA